MGKTSIEWTDYSWNPIRARNIETGEIGWHCEHKSDGCRFCYAETFNRRLGTRLDFKPGHRKNIEIFLDEKMLLAPLKWKTPRKIFVCSMTDLGADFVTDNMLDRIFAIAALCPQHTFIVLTKRPERMREYALQTGTPHRVWEASLDFGDNLHALAANGATWGGEKPWPLRNVWLGTSCEDQNTANERIPHLLETPAAVRFLSCEPLLGPINFLLKREDGTFHEVLKGKTGYPVEFVCFKPSDTWQKLDWVIAGGESGPNARPMHPDWVRSLRDQCVAADVPFFFKQWGDWREPKDDEDFDTSKGRAGNPPAFIVKRDGTVHCFDDFGTEKPPVMIRVGKKRAGRLLDGVEHNGFPEVK